jgi:pimeloyl-ACP methyl ester carboxylesterase
MAYIRSKDSAIYYEEHGGGEPLILLPGLLGTIESHWRRFIPDLAKQFHIIAVDIRGHGRTNNPSAQLRLHQLIADLFSLYETLEIDSAHICGYSLGGYIGLAFGIRHPGRVRSLLMHGTKFFWTPEAVAATTEDFDAKRIMEKVPKWGAQLQQDHSHANGEETWKNLLGSAKDFIETMPTEGLTENGLKLANFPVLVSVGDADEMISQEEAQRLASVLPKGTLNVLTGTRHPMQHVQKIPFIEGALLFFRQHLGAKIDSPQRT